MQGKHRQGAVTAHGINHTRPVLITGHHLDAANEARAIEDRFCAGFELHPELTAPMAMPSEAELAAADLERDTDKGQRLAQRNDARALELQINGPGAL